MNITNSKDLHEFMKFLHPENRPSHFVAYGDQKGNYYRQTYYGDIESPEFMQFIENSDRSKAAITVAINNFSEEGRRKRFLKFVNVFCIDSDGVEIKKVKKFPIKPHLVVGRDETHWHAYWRIDTSSDCSAEDWSDMQRRLSMYYGTDGAITDTSRAMRLPGFFHYKDIKNPAKYEVLHVCTDIKPVCYSDMRRVHELPDSQEQVVLQKQRSISQASLPCKVSIQSDDIGNINRCKLHLAGIPAAIEGANGDKVTFMASCLGQDYGLTKETFFPLLLEHFNKRCLPPWDIQDLMIKVHNAYEYSSLEPGNKAVVIAGDEGSGPSDNVEAEIVDEEWQRQLDVDSRNGKPRNTFKNVYLFLLHHHLLKDKIFYDEFDSHTKHRPIKFIPEKSSDYWTGADTLRLRVFFTEYGFDMSRANIDDAVEAIAHHNSVHPVRKYLDSLVWDGVPRLDTWLTDYYGVEPNAYVSQVGAKTLCAAVARIYKPGTKFDNLLILEGEQGKMKSTGIETLASKKWFVDDLPDINSKDTVSITQGAFLVELADLTAFKKADVNSLKAFLSRSADKKRLPYERRAGHFPRQCIFIGTSNTSSYLQDETGGRRFWPVKTNGEVRVKALREDRDQLWAESVVRFLLGEKLYISDKDILITAREQQEDRRSGDAWEEEIREYLVANNITRIRSKQVWVEVFHNNVVDFGRREQVRIRSCMDAIGFLKTTWRDDKGKVVKGYDKGGTDGFVEV